MPSQSIYLAALPNVVNPCLLLANRAKTLIQTVYGRPYLFSLTMYNDTVGIILRMRECTIKSATACMAFLKYTQGLRAGNFEEYAKWDNIEDSDEKEVQNTQKDIESARARIDLVEPSKTELQSLQGNWTTEFQGDIERPYVIGRQVLWQNTPGKEVSGIYKDQHFNTLFLNGWILDPKRSNDTHKVWLIKDTENEVDETLIWTRPR
eukprot:jgi/Bigna1/127586/aug1.4_g2294